MVITRFCRKVLLTFLLVGTFYSVNSQNLDLGLRGSLGVAYFFNSNFLKSGTDQGYHFSLSDNYGLQAALNFKHGYGLEIGILGGVLRQGYAGTFSSSGSFPAVNIGYQAGESYTSSIAISVIEIPILFRSELKSGIYYEVGLGYEIISGAIYSASYSNPNESVNFNVTNEYPGNNFLVVGGFGKNWKLGVTDFYLNTGLRLTYGLFDLQGVDGHGQYLFGGPSTTLYQPYTGQPYYDSYHSTHAIDMSVNVGIFYRIPTTSSRFRGVQFK